MRQKLNPAQAVIEKFRGAANLSRLIHIRINTICSWATQGIGEGRIPNKHWETLKAAATKQGFILTTAQLNGEEPIK